MNILVIGSGISGLNFSLRAAEKGHRVTIVTKKKLAESSTNLAQGGIAAVLEKTDNFEKHVRDTLEAGSFHNKKSAVEFLVRHGPQAIGRLIELGVPFASSRGKIMLTKEGGHSERRVAFVGDYTGREIERTLVFKTKKNPNIKILEHAFAIDLLVKNKMCCGACVEKNGKPKNLFADITVLATGGLGQIFKYTTNPLIATGDGYAMGFRAGVKLRDMEFIQFHPTAFNKGGVRVFLLSEALRGEDAFLRNEKGERFMKKIHPLKELAPRDVVARAVFEEMKNGNVYLDITHKNPVYIKTRFPKIYATLKRHGYDMTKNLIPIVPAAHYSCGGIETDLHGRAISTSRSRKSASPSARRGIKNLYAFGEVAWTGVHGANRLASNSLLEAIVFSDQILKSVRSVSKYQKSLCFKPPGKINLSKSEFKKISAAKKILKELMWKNVSIVRTHKGLISTINKLSKMNNEMKKIHGFDKKFWELKNMITASLLIAKAAVKRKKSLGCHYFLPDQT